MDDKSISTGGKRQKPYRKKIAQKGRGLRDFKTHTVRQSYAEVIFWALVWTAPLAVFIHPVAGVLTGLAVAYWVSRKNLFMFCVSKDSLKIHKKRVGFSYSIVLKDIEEVSVVLAVRGEGIEEGCEPGEGVVTIRTKDGKHQEFKRVLRAEALGDVIIKRRDFVPKPRTVRNT